MSDNINPLNEDDLNSINEALQQSKIAYKQIELAKRADIDVSDQEKQLQDYEQKLLKLKQVYFPGR